MYCFVHCSQQPTYAYRVGHVKMEARALHQALTSVHARLNLQERNVVCICLLIKEYSYLLGF